MFIRLVVNVDVLDWFAKLVEVIIRLVKHIELLARFVKLDKGSFGL